MDHHQPNQMFRDYDDAIIDNGFLERTFATCMMVVSVFVLGFLVLMFTGCASLPRPMVREISVNGSGNPSAASVTANIVSGIKF